MMMAVHRDDNELLFSPCMRVEPIKRVNQFLVTGVLDNFSDGIAGRAGERGELLVGRIQEFFSL